MSNHGAPAAGARRIPVTVIGDDPLTRAGLIAHLQSGPDIDLRPATPDGDHRPGVAVVATDRVDRAAVGRLRALSSGWKAVLIVAHLREPELLRALDADVFAILLRHDVTPDRLLRAVRASARHDRDLPADAVGHLVDVVVRLRRADPAGRDDERPPTQRELDVLRLIAEGMETREVAAHLSFSERTVKNVLYGVTARYGLRNRTHAVAHVLREGYL
ncbi:helix-turn-helix transcriptional regulator [Cryptosporangium arvum]|uniref:Response regulator containing a CheY-like receiver domain and an HTH DNA-binding domain n=1 Tax=Cryptosporangium arvum DSM 44712 TaxID=927661 RepID=A0A010ZUC5_9ACTN|nr:response regulator transcription factor [Cryptosporangium arvum]EXG82264.1 response regulator containing a CheY-like receiver domain and an HTH DNA-binding domain [Cryptosporangium arvum DSM 44712]